MTHPFLHYNIDIGRIITLVLSNYIFQKHLQYLPLLRITPYIS